MSSTAPLLPNSAICIIIHALFTRVTVAKARLISRDSSFIGAEETVHGCAASFAAFAKAALEGDSEKLCVSRNCIRALASLQSHALMLSFPQKGC